MKKYKAAVVGCGKIGIEENFSKKNLRPGSHAGGYENHSKTALAGLVDTDKRRLLRAKKLFPEVPLFHSLRDMLLKIKPDIVSVTTTTKSHFKVVCGIADFGVKVIVCEKPLSMDATEALKMVRLCKKNNILLIVNHSRLFDPTILSVKDKIRELGPFVSGNAYYARGIYNGGAHLISLLRYYFGSVESVVGFRSKNTENWSDLEGDMNIDGIIFFKNGVRIAIQALDSNNYNIFDIFLNGKRGNISLRNFGLKIEYRLPAISNTFTNVRTLGKISDSTFVNRSMVLSMIDNVIDCIENGERPLSGGDESLLSILTIESLVKSARNGKLIKLNE